MKSGWEEGPQLKAPCSGRCLSPITACSCGAVCVCEDGQTYSESSGGQVNWPLVVFLLIGGHYAPDHHHHVSVTIHHNRTSSLSKQVNCPSMVIGQWSSGNEGKLANQTFLGPRGPLRTPLVPVPSRPVPSSATKTHATSHYSFSDSKLILFLIQTRSSRNLSHSTQNTEQDHRGPF